MQVSSIITLSTLSAIFGLQNRSYNYHIFLFGIYYIMQNSEANNINGSLGNYYAFHSASAILSQNKDREIGKLFAESNDKLLVD
jgi:hypothetical protein